MKKSEFVILILRCFLTRNEIVITKKRFSEEFSYKTRHILTRLFLILFLISILAVFVFIKNIALTFHPIFLLFLTILFTFIVYLILILGVVMAPSLMEDISNNLISLSNLLLMNNKIAFIRKHKSFLRFLKDEIRVENNPSIKEILIRNYICFKELLPPMMIYREDNIKKKISSDIKKLSKFDDFPALYKRMGAFVGSLSHLDKYKILLLSEGEIKIKMSSMGIINYFRYGKYKNRYKIKYYFRGIINSIENHPKILTLAILLIISLFYLFFPDSPINKLIENIHP